ncbi:MAG TPA: fibro-slime domain-containing protein [Polyangiaceae bacterium]|nr:fibro-slime domain-containing protein [Polyangiaceae bacterium]
MKAGVVVFASILGACSVQARPGDVGIFLSAAEADADADGAGGHIDVPDADDAGGHIDIPDAPWPDAPEKPPTIVLMTTIRDFKKYDPNDPSTVPDFGVTAVNDGVDREIVTATLGADNKPVYKNATGGTVTTAGKAWFNLWYRDVPGTNINVPYTLTLTLTPDGEYEYDSRKTGILETTSTGTTRRIFTPIDDGSPYQTAFGNQGEKHNFSFTCEIHTVFTYRGGELLRFRSDDDIFVYVDKKLIINLGGYHGATGAEIDVGVLELAPGNDYPLDVFYAERKGKTGELLITTSLDLRPRID